MLNHVFKGFVRFCNFWGGQTNRQTNRKQLSSNNSRENGSELSNSGKSHEFTLFQNKFGKARMMFVLFAYLLNHIDIM